MAQKRVLMKGNEVIAEAAIRAGCRNYFGYPITPQTEVMHYMAKKMVQVGGNFVQAESEVAAINMVYGAAAAGFRVMTSSSSPGISLKQEGISYIAGAELPAVVVNIVRAGPGLGGIQPAQGDYFQATKGGGHGDYRNIVIAPASVQELYELVVEAFNLADKYRMTCMIIGDGTLGQMMEPVAFRDEEPVETIEKPWAACGRKGDSFHHTVTSIYIDPDVLEKKNLELQEKYKIVEANEVRYESVCMDDDPEIVITAFSTCSRISRNVIRQARDLGIKVGMIRPITLWPFPKAVLNAAADKVKAFISVELSMGQMIEDIELATRCKKPVLLCNRVGGMIPTTEDVLNSINEANSVGGDK